MTEDKKDEVLARPWAALGRDPAELVQRQAGGLWALTKQPGTNRCIMLAEDGLCELHRHWGPSAKPRMCQRFPHLVVPSAERVWVTANYGCKAVQEGLGDPLPEARDDLAETFARELEGIREDADIGYPIGHQRVEGGIELEALVEALAKALGDRLFPALATLAAFACDARTVSPQPAPVRLQTVSSSVRYALALSLYSDAVDASSFWGRLKGAWALPRMLTFRHRYTSRLLSVPVDMAAVLAHPGALPLESEGLLLAWLRSRLRGRQVLKDVPNFAAGVTRLLLQADAVLYFARALAPDRAITHPNVLRALEVLELYIANQQVVTTLARMDPRLPRFWQDPTVAIEASALFAPQPDGP